MKKIDASQCRFAVKLVCCIAFGSTSNARYLLKSTTITL